MSYIQLENCVKGHVYRLNSRNLEFGVFNGKSGFVGIREKFKHKHLDTEYHYSAGPRLGTVKPLEKVGELPEGVSTKETLCIIDKFTKKEVAFSKEKRCWCFVENNEHSQDIFPINVNNEILFNYLKKYT